MKYRLLLFALLSGALLSVTSCSDPTSVGEELVSDSLSGADPRAFEITPSVLDAVSSTSRTGINLLPTTAPGTGGSRAWRFLAGAVNDPISGTIVSEGYIDFQGSAPRDSSIRNADVDSLNAALRLRPTYLHGDTTSTLEINLFELSTEAEMTQAPADTSFPVRRQLGTTYSLTPTDSVVTLPLPDPWIADHLSAIQSDDSFDDDVNGFKMSAAQMPSSANRRLIAGFAHGSAILRVTTSTDTIDFNALKSFTNIERRGTPEVPLTNRTLLQDGAGSNLLMEWKFDQPPLDTLQNNAALNTADVIVPIDTAEMAASLDDEPSFNRPTVNGYRVLARRKEGAPTCAALGLPALSSSGNSCTLPTRPADTPAAARLTSQTSETVFGRALDGNQIFTSFQVEVATRSNPSVRNSVQRGLPSSIPVLVRTSNAATVDLPRATLVVTLL